MKFRVYFSVVCAILGGCFSGNLSAQEALPVEKFQNNLVVIYKNESVQTLAAIAQKFHAPTYILAAYNSKKINDQIRRGESIKIPIGPYNVKTTAPTTYEQNRMLLIFDADKKYRLKSLARQLNIRAENLKKMNPGLGDKISKREKVKVGWVLYENNKKSKEKNAVAKPTVREDNPIEPIEADSSQTATMRSPFSEKYQVELSRGMVPTVEKGAAAFFTLQKGNQFFAFHNLARKGSIVKVFVPGTGATIYAKVLGAVPDSKRFHNSVLALSSNAQLAIGLRDTKVWCEVSYFEN